MYHRVIAFNPDECDLNGGKLSASDCMKYAREYAQKYLPAQECVWVLHKEHCKADGTDRYAIHMAVNRTNLETGNRFDQGRTRHAKVERANQIRDMDKEWGLRQLEKGRRNSRTHARQLTREETLMQKRGERSNKNYIRDAVRSSMREMKAEHSREGFTKAMFSHLARCFALGFLSTLKALSSSVTSSTLTKTNASRSIAMMSAVPFLHSQFCSRITKSCLLRYHAAEMSAL